MKKAIYAQKKAKHAGSMKKFYERKPLIATSLTLMLSAGVMYGNELENLPQIDKQVFSEGIETITISGESKTIDLSNQTPKKANIQSDINGGSLTIKNGTLEGNIGGQVLESPSTKGLTVTFENAIMKGNIQTGRGQNSSDGNDFQRKDVIFKGKNNSDIVLEGDIISYGSGYGNSLDRNRGNHVVFETGSMKGNIYAKRDGYQRVGYNEVTFKGEGAKLEGNVGAFGGSSKGNVSSTNRVVFEQSGSIQGKISADGFLQYQTFFLGKNEIIFKGNGTNTIEKASSQTSDLDVIVAYTGINEILFDNHGTNIIKGNIVATDEWGNYYSWNGRESVNTITFNGTGPNTIEGDVLAKKSKYEGNYSHKNTITFNGGTLNTIKGKISTDNNTDDKYSGQNTLTLNNATLTIENPVETNKVEITNES
ncbi:hypothetical protein LW138_07080, partial [Helicobacter sp. faydin-H17]|nr:hypothetical protein [Helicobacter kayseriensis]MCE3049200.1 hypothetical protein [Helicobacter kayseriensis]